MPPGPAGVEPREPVLAAGLVTTTDLPEVFGTRSLLMVDTGHDVIELNVAQTDQLITDLTRFTARLHSLRALLAVAVADDLPGDPEAIEQWHREHAERIAARDRARQT